MQAGTSQGKEVARGTALVVGASRGLGLGLADALAQRGWQVTGTARSAAGTAALQGASHADGGRITPETLDVDRDDQLDALAHRLQGRRFDLLFVNAGIAGPAHQSVAEVTRDELAQLLWTNAIAPLRIAERLLPHVAPGGTVAFMSSVLGSVAGNTSGGFDLYRVSKASLNMLARSFAAGHAGRQGLVVLNLHPGWVRTDMGGPQAPLDIATSVRGLADVLEARRPPGHYYLDYQGHELPW